MESKNQKKAEELLKWVKPELIQLNVGNTEGKSSPWPTEDSSSSGPS